MQSVQSKSYIGTYLTEVGIQKHIIQSKDWLSNDTSSEL